MLIAQLTDTHILSAHEFDKGTAKQRIKDLKRCLLDINRLIPLPDVVIHTGDITQSAKTEEYQLTLELLKILKVPFYLVPGNRDSRKIVRQTFFSEIEVKGTGDEPILYEVDSFQVRLIGLDTSHENEGLGFVSSEQLVQLDKMLAANTKPTAIFMHHPPIPIDTPSGRRFEFVSKMSASNLLKIITKHHQICRVFCGHSHRPFIKKINMTEISTVPSIASDLRRGIYPPYLKEVPVYQLHQYKQRNQFVSHSRLLESPKY